MPVEKWSDTVIIVHLGDDPQFSDDMDTVCAMTPPARNYVVDLSVVHHVNSSNIASLLRLRHQVQERNDKLVLCSVGNEVWSTLLITGLDKIFEFSENVTTALATIQMKDPKVRNFKPD